MALALSVALVSCGKHQPALTAAHPAAKYHCPMHPSIVSDKPGDCPICGMKLVPINEEQHEPAAAPAKRTMYRSTMNPNEVSDKPGKDSMGMEMVPFEVGAAEHAAVPGLTAVSITPAARERMGLTFGTVEKRALARDVRTSARIVADETRLYAVSTKVEGWVDRLFVATTGQQVNRGDPLLTIYSPELVSAQNEYLLAMRGGGADDSLKRSARRRLQLWDISDEQIERLEKTGEAERTLTLYAPVRGWVTQRDIVAGKKVLPGEALLNVADLTSVWAMADIYESDLPFVKVGMPVAISLPYWPDKTFSGEVSFLSPTLNPESRTLSARLVIPNPELLLRPEMFGDARLSFDLGERLAVPVAAVMRTGMQTYVFRDGGNGKLVPVEVKIGPRCGDNYEVVAGLNEGERVVTSANFLVDSESSMKAALEALANK
jgi:multidrug efflux pump subunit AcrA (membrane-fusion protein)